METDRTAPLSDSVLPAPRPLRPDPDQANHAQERDPLAMARQEEYRGIPSAEENAGSQSGATALDGAASEDSEWREDADFIGPPEPRELVPVGASTPEAVSERRPGRVRAVFRETLETVLLALLIFVSVRAVIQNFKVEGSSMEPNLHSGQYLLVNKAAYFALDLAGLGLNSLFPADDGDGSLVVHPFGAPNRGDVIVFRYPKDPRRDFIKRVIAVPGDTVEIRMGKVFVNGQRLDEPYIVENPAYSKDPQVVPADNYYVLGDNRNNSSDSHVWGPVPREFIIGKAWLSYWPLSEWGLAPNYTVAAQDAPVP